MEEMINERYFRMAYATNMHVIQGIKLYLRILV
jgi:hypothetical protein